MVDPRRCWPAQPVDGSGERQSRCLEKLLRVGVPPAIQVGFLQTAGKRRAWARKRATPCICHLQLQSAQAHIYIMWLTTHVQSTTQRPALQPSADRASETCVSGRCTRTSTRRQRSLFSMCRPVHRLRIRPPSSMYDECKVESLIVGMGYRFEDVFGSSGRPSCGSVEAKL